MVLNTAAKKLSPYHQSFFDACEERSVDCLEGLFGSVKPLVERRMPLISARQLWVRWRAET